MSEVEDGQLPSELDALKKRADLMQIKYHPNIGVDSLRDKINAAVSGEGVEAVQAVATELASSMPNLGAIAQAEQAAAPEPAKPETADARKNRLRREATKLVRIRLTCMNPAKKNWGGDMFCVSNRNFGTIQRHVPFEREWHVEAVLLDMIRERQYLTFDTKKTKIAGITIKEPRSVPEYAIAILEPLTSVQLKELGQRQAMAAGTQE